jgi:hypothetical protein
LAVGHGRPDNMTSPTDILSRKLDVYVDDRVIILQRH